MPRPVDVAVLGPVVAGTGRVGEATGRADLAARGRRVPGGPSVDGPPGRSAPRHWPAVTVNPENRTTCAAVALVGR